MLGLFGGAKVDWNNIVGTVAAGEAENNDQVMPFSDNITAATVGIGAFAQLYYVKNGAAPVTYSGAFAVVAGDLLRWGVMYKSSGSGSVTVSRATGPTVIDAFNVTIT
jgi:hypothetical protein